LRKDTSLSIAKYAMEPVDNRSNINFLGFRRCPVQTYAGIDVHSSSNFIGVINEKDKILNP